MYNLRLLIREILCEKRSHNINRYEEAKNKLESFIDKGYFFHMTNDPTLPFVNVHINLMWYAPLGIYVFPLTSKFVSYFFNRKPNEFNHYSYIVIYEPKSDNYIKTSKYSWDDFLIDAEKLGLTPKNLKTFIKKLDVKQPVRGLISLFDPKGQYKYVRDEKFPARSNRSLLKLGYTGIIDDAGQGVIHYGDAENIQGFFVSSKFVNVVDVIDNPRLLWRRYASKQTNSNIYDKFMDNIISELLLLFEDIFERKNNINKIQQILNNLSVDQQLYLFRNVDIAMKLFPFWVYIHNPSEKVQLLGIELDPTSILHFENPTPKVRQNALSGSPNLIFELDNPTDEEIKLVSKLTNKTVGSIKKKIIANVDNKTRYAKY